VSRFFNSIENFAPWVTGAAVVVVVDATARVVVVDATARLVVVVVSTTELVDVEDVDSTTG
jgi:hypothetical protein